MVGWQIALIVIGCISLYLFIVTTGITFTNEFIGDRAADRFEPCVHLAWIFLLGTPVILGIYIGKRVIPWKQSWSEKREKKRKEENKKQEEERRHREEGNY